MKKKIIGSVIAAILIIAIVSVVIWYRSGTEENSALDIKAGSGETIVYATIDKVTGNDIEVSILDEETAQQMIELSQAAKEAASTDSKTSEKETSGSGMPDMSGGGMPGMSGGGMPDMSGGGMPDMSGGGMPDGGEMPDMEKGERPDGGERPSDGERPEGGRGQKEQEKASYRIPVGTDVITTLGATTTFSHLEAGDTIAILI